MFEGTIWCTNVLKDPWTYFIFI